jgi:aryl-alcohol dehydrogenase-like predicted oxidoreductase
VIRGLVKRYLGHYDALFAEAGLDALLEEGESRDAFMIRFALSHPGVSTGIVGSKDVTHVRENVAAVERGPLPTEVYAEAVRRLTEVGVRPEQIEAEEEGDK